MSPPSVRASRTRCIRRQASRNRSLARRRLRKARFSDVWFEQTRLVAVDVAGALYTDAWFNGCVFAGVQAFTCVLAGGGLHHRGAFGETDELARKPVKDLVRVPDFFATIHAALGLDYTKNLYDGDRPVPLTDQGQPIKELLA